MGAPRQGLTEIIGGHSLNCRSYYNRDHRLRGALIELNHALIILYRNKESNALVLFCFSDYFVQFC